jgi:hypothetical protein
MVTPGGRRYETQESGPAFAPVVVEERLLVKEAPVAPAASIASGMIEIVIGAATVRVASGIDSASLQAGAFGRKRPID